MKRVLSLVLVLLLVFSISACGKKETSSGRESIDIEYYAGIGSIPECSYSLGQDVDELNADLEEHYNTVEDEMVYEVTEGKTTAKIDNGTFQYYYVKDKKEDGVSYIVNFDTAYGFNIGTVSVEILDALNEYKYTEEAMNDDNAFFVLGATEGKVVKYEFSENAVSFIFVNDALYATAVYKISDWE